MRSELYGIEKERIEPKKILKGTEMSKALQENKEIIEVASPIIGNLYDMVHDTGFFIISSQHLIICFFLMQSLRLF